MQLVKIMQPAGFDQTPVFVNKESISTMSAARNVTPLTLLTTMCGQKFFVAAPIDSVKAALLSDESEDLTASATAHAANAAAPKPQPAAAPAAVQGDA